MYTVKGRSLSIPRDKDRGVRINKGMYANYKWSGLHEKKVWAISGELRNKVWVVCREQDIYIKAFNKTRICRVITRMRCISKPNLYVYSKKKKSKGF